MILLMVLLSNTGDRRGGHTPFSLVEEPIVGTTVALWKFTSTGGSPYALVALAFSIMRRPIEFIKVHISIFH